LWLVVVALVLLVGFLAPPVPASVRVVTAHIEEPFEYDGQLYPSGKLTLRQLSEFNPVSTLNEIRVDGRSLGVVLGRAEAHGVTATRNEMIFERNPRGRLVLVSVALEGQPVRKLFHPGPHVEVRPWQVASDSRTTTMAAVE
jgi:hypothetical protein